MKTIFLLPPSEWKNKENLFLKEELSFNFTKPLEILKNASEKDLKCKDTRFSEAQKLNESLAKNWTNKAINRYSGVMYNAIDYSWMTEKWQKFFLENFLIFSGLYWIVKPNDKIANYKLPIEAKWLYLFWWDKIPETIKSLKADLIVNLLPISYAKLIWLGTNCSKHKKKLDLILENKNTKIVNINFLKEDSKKISHWVKKIKWQWIKDICEKNISDYRDFGGEIVENGQIIDVNIKVW